MKRFLRKTLVTLAALTAWSHSQVLTLPALGTEPDSILTTQEQLVDQVQEKVVKLFGAGGARGLESYQSGILVGNNGHIVTSWTTVLDVAKVRVVVFDGRRLDATVVGVDPANEIALLQVEDAGLTGFPLDSKPQPTVGQRVFGVSNLFGIATGDEYCSVQKGVVMAIAPLTQRRGKTKSLYQGKVYVLDVMTNNPGASGGALVNLRGEWIGMLGKEIRDEQSGIWLNYALPLEVVQSSIDRILKGTATLDLETAKSVEKPHRLPDLGLTLIPDVLPKTPAFVDDVRSGSIAAQAGLQTNDLILLVNDQRIDSRKSLEKILSTINRADSFQLLVQRGQELIRIQVRP
ncbi:Periplasmic serine endoprotease DegP precursor [Pirellula sp. SH-Sr6A]|uniref:S1C family serine protease n=1 Tax=Pirellula sp. SH-Sr6A TaxID=1632865 RepID=UPI00078B8DA3|nr:S1C family serine protease [Pirellula sp. SH-Sr6A]AMV30501.1 Periplasmic serine endoprotease DegP precursor [Pirellula sp. SH-Sr6A]